MQTQTAVPPGLEVEPEISVSEIRKISNVLFKKVNSLSDEQENELYILVDKRYVPGMEELARWSKSQREFYEHLCSLTHFIEGCRAIGEYEDVSDSFEVESDTDDAAQDMKVDGEGGQASMPSNEDMLQDTQVLGTADTPQMVNHV